LADGGVLASGDFTWAGGQAAGPVVRLNADGTLQTSNWLASAMAAGVLGVGRPPQTCQLADGRVLVAFPAGSITSALVTSTKTVLVLRFSTAGVLDNGYALTLTPAAGDTASVSGLWPLSSGQILITGHFVQAGGHLTRDVVALAPDGTLNPFYASQTDFAAPVTVAADGSLVGMAPSVYPAGSVLPPVVVRLDPSGALANSWTLAGAVNFTPTALAISSSGDALVAGNPATPYVIIFDARSLAPRDVDATPVVYRLQRGNPGPSVFYAASSFPTTVSEIHALADGGALLVGTVPQLGAAAPSGLLRLNPDGTPNLLFAAPSLAGETVTSLQALSDGWLATLTASSGSPIRILRKLGADFSLRADFLADLRASSDPSAAWALPDGSVLLQGNFANPAGKPQRFARLRASGSLDFTAVPSAPETTAASIAAVDSLGRVYLTGALLGQNLTIPTGSVEQTTAVSNPSANGTTTNALTGAQLERFSIDGIADTAFGLQALPEAADTIAAVQIDPQNRVLVAGAASSSQPRLIRLQATGAIDPTFNFVPSAIGSLRPASASIAATGTGYFVADNSGNVFQLQDSGAATGTPVYGASGLQLLTPATGALFAGGSFSAVVGNATPAIARLLPSGLPDLGWLSGLAAGSTVTGVQPLPDGRLLIAGAIKAPGQTKSTGSAILSAAGGIDFNESLPSAAILTAAADGSIYAFQLDGSIQRLTAVARLALSLTASEVVGIAGDSVRLDLSGAASGAGPVVWTLNGTVLAGASGSSLLLAATGPAVSGWYTAQVSTPSGLVSASVYLTIAGSNARIANASARAFLGSGDAAQVIGFVVNGTSSEPALMRLVADDLAQFGVPDYTTSAMWSFSANGHVLPITLANFGYPSYIGPETFQDATLLAGAFPLGNSLDETQSLLSPLSTIPYTVMRSAPAGQSGVALFELYLTETPTSLASGRRLGNFSCRAEVGQGDRLFIVGFVIAGNKSLPVLVRGLGPALTRFGVADPLDQPVLTIYQGQTVVASNSGWQNQATSAQVAAAAAQAGAFALSPGADSALLLTLAPGAYTAVLQSNDQVGVVGMIELYDASN